SADSGNLQPVAAPTWKEMAALKTTSIQPEIDDNIHLYRYRMSVQLGWFKPPSADGHQCFFIQSHAKRANHVQVARNTVNANRRQQLYLALELRLARFVRKFRLRIVNRARHADAVAYFIDTVTAASVPAIAAAHSFSGAKPAAVIAAHSAAHSRPVRGRSKH